MKSILFLACTFLPGALLAQTDTSMLAAQRAELKTTLQAIDQKMADCQTTYYAAQKVKVKYDTVGLWQFRYDYHLLKEERRKQEIVFIQQHPDYLISLNTLQDVIGPLPDDIQADDRLFKKLKKSIRESEEGIKTQKLIDRFMTVRIGAIAPAFSAPDTSGNPVHLSDFKGKYVLLDFWASWCGPCREENPIVVAAYNRFKDKNFDILSVSLDKSDKKADWEKAIQHDGMPWKHASDLKFWDSDIAKLYTVRSIPQNFLIDPKGKIVAKNLRGEELAKTLEEILK